MVIILQWEILSEFSRSIYLSVSQLLQSLVPDSFSIFSGPNVRRHPQWRRHGRFVRFWCASLLWQMLSLLLWVYNPVAPFLLQLLIISVQVIVATQRATIDGLSNSEAQKYFDLNGPPAPIYRKNAYCVASTVLLWLGMLGTFARLVSSFSFTLFIVTTTN